MKISEPKLKVKTEKPSCIDPKFLVRGAITYSGGVSSIQGGGEYERQVYKIFKG